MTIKKIITLLICLSFSASLLIAEESKVPEGAEALKNYLKLVKQVPRKQRKARFIRRWYILGPYKADKAKFGDDGNGGQNVINDKFVDDEPALTPAEGKEVGDKKWERFDTSAFVDIEMKYADLDYAVCYLGTYVYVPEKVKKCLIMTGSDDYMRIYLNGEDVHMYNKERRGANMDEDQIKVSLNAGWNKIVIKVVDVIYGWGIYFRLTDKKGKASYLVEETPPEAAE